MDNELSFRVIEEIANCNETILDRAYLAKRASLSEIIEFCKQTRQHSQQLRALIDLVLAQSRTGLISTIVWPPKTDPV